MSGGGGLVGVGVYGKVTTQADFLRWNAGEFSQAEMDRWFETAFAALREEGKRLPEEPTGFMLAPGGGKTAFVGAFAPSKDAVGRTFPLVVFTDLPAAAVAPALPALPSLARRFVDEAMDMLSGGKAVDMPGAEIVERVQALRAVDVPRHVLSVAATAVQSLDREPVEDLVTAAGSPRQLGYALRTFGAACDQAVKSGPTGAGGVITVDAPCPNMACRQFWLALAQKKLRWPETAPSMLWTDGSAGRFLLTLGPPSPNAISYLANPRHRATRFWPLRIDVSTAIDQAMDALTGDQRRRLENSTSTLGDLLTAFV